MSRQDKRKLVSVFIPIYNGIEYLEEVLTAVFSQKLREASFEVILCDSGSTDRSLEIIEKFHKKYSKITRIVYLKKGEYNHGGTRNMGAKMSKGEFVAYLTQDATPVSPHWLQNMIQPMLDDDFVMGVFGKHIPRRGHNPFVKRDIEGHFDSYQLKKGYLLHTKKDPDFLSEGLRNFYSDVNSCLRKEFWVHHPYQVVDYCEDQLMGKEIIEKNYKKAYSSDAAVIHSHQYSLWNFFKRCFDEYRGLKITLGYVDASTFLNIVPNTLHAWWHEVKYILQKNYTFFEKIKWFYYAFWYVFLRRLGAILGGRHEKVPSIVYSSLSLEKKVKISS